ncbi:family 16 glycosylhydrolase [Actibacterium sp. 188UL27-1]|uniref:family 16 glycosylhydrolase n=1 Tax=Actibacterium sp. 188UL27-1 TaxID=2786961 RepID=UPI0019597AED|nr:family 16 glycosylhydrolase [Actibacterium sp. 188UL27-1]MBM7069093.1 family 16 glycosylhydrolase [Actibacterium sp. 188UL27-1]
MTGSAVEARVGWIYLSCTGDTRQTCNESVFDPMFDALKFCISLALAGLSLISPAWAIEEETQVPFETQFDELDPEVWYISDFANAGGWIDTAWSRDNLTFEPGRVTLEMNGTDAEGKRFTGAEFKTRRKFHYGRYEVRMTPSGETGALSSFFVYTGPFFDDPKSEIDFEFVGEDTTKVLLTYHTPDGSDGMFVDLGFDAAEAEHTYAFEWAPNSITWYVNDLQVRHVERGDIGLPPAPGQIYMSVWTGSSDFTGVADPDVIAQASYSSVRFIPRTAPVAVEDEFQIIGDQTLTLDLLANDYAHAGQLDRSSVTIVKQGEGGTVTLNRETAEVTFKPSSDFAGSTTFSYTVSDGAEVSNEAVVTINVVR